MGKDAASPKGPLVYNVDMGGGVVANLFDGLSAEEIEQLTEGQEPPETETAAKQNDADGEDKEEETPKPEKSKAEPEAEPKKKEEPEKAPEKEKPAEPEKPKEPEKYKFKVKFRGVEEDREYTLEQIQANLNRLKMFDENQQELWKQKQEVEPFSHIVKSEWFKQALKDAQERGEITPPPEPPQVPPTVQFELMRRKADPDFEEVRASIREYASTLTWDAAALIDNNAEVFLSEYDRHAKIVRERKAPPPPPEPPKVDPKVQEKILAAKEKAKESAVVEKPGTAPSEDLRAKELAKRNRELTKRMRAGDMDAAVELAMQFYPDNKT